MRESKIEFAVPVKRFYGWCVWYMYMAGTFARKVFVLMSQRKADSRRKGCKEFVFSRVLTEACKDCRNLTLRDSNNCLACGLMPIFVIFKYASHSFHARDIDLDNEVCIVIILEEVFLYDFFLGN